MNIVDEEVVDKEKFTSEVFVQKFEDKQDGTKLVLDYLKAAKEKGARYISNLKISIASTQDEKKTFCTTEIHPKSETKSKLKQTYTPSTYKGKYKLKPVTRMVTEYSYNCQYRTKPVMKMETTYTQQYDYYSKSYRSVPKTRYVTRYESVRECNYQPVSKMVLRYEYQYETEYIPPKWGIIEDHYTGWQLEESEPLCEDLNSDKSHEISGLIFYPKKKE